MNNFSYPFPPINNNYFINIPEEIIKLRERINILEKKIKNIENNNDNNYLKKDDNYYMI